MTARSPLSIIVVNYNSGRYLRECALNLANAAKPMDAEMIVVDNASTDDSLAQATEAVPELRIMHSPVNYGYGRACNRGAAAAGGRLICFLNPDTIPSAGSLSTLARSLEADPRVAAVGPKIFNPDGTLYPSCRVVPGLGVSLGHAFLGFLWPNNRFSRAYRMSDWDHNSRRDVDWVSGAAMVVSRESFESVGGFDEGFFMYVEDVDLCDRLRKAGYKIVYEPSADMVHHVAGSSRRTPFRMIRHHHFSLIRYSYNKMRDEPAIVIFPFVAAGLLARMLLAWTDHLIRRSIPKRT
ncbi:MAG: glycosyltransferase family 2 protein [Actinomycetota bacterium]